MHRSRTWAAVLVGVAVGLGGPAGPAAGQDGIAFSPDGRVVATATRADRLAVHVWERTTGKHLRTLRHPAPDGSLYEVDLVAFLPGGKQLLSKLGGSDPEARVWDWAEGRALRRLPLWRAQFATFGADLSADGRVLVRTGNPGCLLVLDVPTGRDRVLSALAPDMEQDPRKRGGVEYALAPDGRTLATPLSERVDFWDVATGRHLRTLKGLDFRDSLRFAPDGRTLGFFSSRRTIELCEAATGRRLRQLPLPEGVRGVHLTFAPGGDRLAALGVGPPKQPGPAAGADRQQVWVWELSSGRLEHVWPADEVRTPAFTPDGRTLGAVEGTGAVRLWNVTTGRGQVLTPRNPD